MQRKRLEMDQAGSETESETETNLEANSQFNAGEEAVVAQVAKVLEVSAPPKDLYLARQPVFDRSMKVYGYELLYSNRGAVAAGTIDSNAASAQVMINAFLDLDIESISNNLPSFIPISQDFLVGRLPLPFPPQSIILEIPAAIAITEEVIASMKHFADEGFRLALDRYTFDDKHAALLSLVDIVKVDVSNCDPDQLEQGMRNLALHELKVIAQHVDTREQLQLCMAVGFVYFQGRFISKPVVLTGHVLKPSRIALLKILKLLEDPDCDISMLEELITQDVTISYKILRIINSAYYGFRRKIESVKQAVVSLGLKVIRDWFIVISLTDIDDKPQELMFLTLHRARMMQLLAAAMGLNKDTGFTVGLFSAIDAIMDQPMEQILQSLPLSGEITEALLRREGTFGEMLEVVLQYEQGNWRYMHSVGFEMSELGTFYFEAMYWARGLFEQMKSEK